MTQRSKALNWIFLALGIYVVAMLGCIGYLVWQIGEAVFGWIGQLITSVINMALEAGL